MRSQSAAVSPISTGPTLDPGVTVARSARLFRESLQRCRRDVRSPIIDERIRNTIKRVDCGRSQAPEHIVTVLYSAFQRGADRASVEAPLRALLAAVANWYDQGSPSVDDLTSLVRRETQTQAAAAVAEMDVVLRRDRAAIAAAAECADAQLVALEDLSLALHRKLVA